MTHPQKHIEQLEEAAVERELISQLTPSKKTRNRNEQRASDLRDRIRLLKARLKKLTKDHLER